VLPWSALCCRCCPGLHWAAADAAVPALASSGQAFPAMCQPVLSSALAARCCPVWPCLILPYPALPFLALPEPALPRAALCCAEDCVALPGSTLPCLNVPCAALRCYIPLLSDLHSLCYICLDSSSVLCSCPHPLFFMYQEPLRPCHHPGGSFSRARG